MPQRQGQIFESRIDSIPVGPEAERGRLEFGGIHKRRGAPGGGFRSVRSETDRLFIHEARAHLDYINKGIQITYLKLSSVGASSFTARAKIGGEIPLRVSLLSCDERR